MIFYVDTLLQEMVLLNKGIRGLLMWVTIYFMVLVEMYDYMFLYVKVLIYAYRKIQWNEHHQKFGTQCLETMSIDDYRRALDEEEFFWGDPHGL